MIVTDTKANYIYKKEVKFVWQNRTSVKNILKVGLPNSNNTTKLLA